MHQVQGFENTSRQITHRPVKCSSCVRRRLLWDIGIKFLISSNFLLLNLPELWACLGLGGPDRVPKAKSREKAIGRNFQNKRGTCMVNHIVSKRSHIWQSRCGCKNVWRARGCNNGWVQVPSKWNWQSGAVWMYEHKKLSLGLECEAPICVWPESPQKEHCLTPPRPVSKSTKTPKWMRRVSGDRPYALSLALATLIGISDLWRSMVQPTTSFAPPPPQMGLCRFTEHFEALVWSCIIPKLHQGITIGLEIGLLTKIAFWSLLKVQSETDLWVKTVRKKSVAKLV